MLPAHQVDLSALATSGLLTSSPQSLAEFGFVRAHVCDSRQSAGDIALAAARAALDDAGLDPAQVDLVIWASARPENHLRPADDESDVLMNGFRYASGWLQDTLGLDNADVTAVAQQGCSTMFAALRVARSLLLAEPERHHALCVGVDVLPPGSRREILYNVISDAACAVVVSRDCSRDRWVGFRQLSRGSYWDPAARGPEIIAAYFPTASKLIQQLVADHGLRPEQIDVVVPTGVNHSSWEILLRLVGIPEDRLYRDLPPFGHTMTSDNFLYLQALRRCGRVPSGSRLLLFTYGFGSSWCAMLLEH